MKNIILSSLIILTSCSLFSQGPTNVNDKNIYAWFSQANLFTDDDDCLGGDIGSDKSDCLLNHKKDDYKITLKKDGSVVGNPFTLYGNGPGQVPITKEMIDGTSSTGSYQFKFDVWEDDDNNDTYNSSVDDDGCGSTEKTVDIFAIEPGTVDFEGFNCPNSSNGGRLKYVYRYNKGDNIADALNFGPLTADENKAHRNRVNLQNSIPSSGISTAIEYTNQLINTGVGSNFNDNSEVVYKFKINSSTACLEIDIKAKFISSSSGPGVKIAKLAGNEIEEFIGSATGSSTYTNTYATGDYIIVMETSSEDAFDLTVEPSWTEIDPGTISYNGSLSGPEGFNPPVFSNSASASGSFTGYQWTYKGPSDGSFEPISGAMAVSYNRGQLSEIGFHKFRREAINSTCPGVDEETNEITIDIQGPIGDVSGFVKVDDMITGSCSGAGINGAEVTITNLETLTGGVVPGAVVKSTTTNSSGSFNLPAFYVGEAETQWRVVATYFDHEIIPTENIITLSNAQPTQTGLCFEDAQTFTCTGLVFHNINGNVCGMDGVELNLIDHESNDIVGLTQSEANGEYSLSVPYSGDFRVEATLDEHTFEVLDKFFINTDQFDINIEDLTTRTVAFNFNGGCESVIGSLSFQLFDSISCNPQTLVTNPTTGYFQTTLPAKRFKVQNVVYTHPSGASNDFQNTFIKTQVENYFNNQNIIIDLTYQDTVHNFEYHADPVLEVYNWPELPACTQTVVGANIPYPVIKSTDEIELNLKAWDIIPGLHTTLPLGCPLDTGTVIIEDGIRSKTNQQPVLDTLIVDSMELVYILEAGDPNIVSPYNKYIYFNLISIDSTVSQYEYTAIAEGVRPRENTFTTVSPEMPLHILRDPPGDQSYASLIEGQSLSTINTISTSISGGVEVKVKATYEKEVELIGTKTYGEIGGSIGVSGGNVSSTSTEITSTVTSEYSTSSSENPNSIGESADVFIGAAYNLIYALSDVIRINESICEVVSTVDLMVNPDLFATTYVYTTNTIEHNIVPSLQELRDLSTDQEEIEKYDDQITIWEDLLIYNSSLKEAAELQENISYGAGVTQSHTEEIVTTETKSSEWHQSLDLGLFGAYGVSVFGIGGAIEVDATFNLTATQDETNIEGSTFETSFTLDDNDNNGAGDLFTVDVLKDQVYGVPVFNTAAAETSCPYEEGTLPRHDATLTAIPSTQFDVPAEEGANFTLVLSNVSQTGETMSYFLDYNSTSNFDGADVSYNEVYEGNRIELEFGQSFVFTGITVLPNATNNIYSYEGIEFRVYAACLDGGNEYVPDQSREIAEVFLNVYFTPPCSDVVLASPDDTWISSTTINPELPISITDYDFTSITNLKLEYKTVGSPAWLTGQVYDINGFNPNSSVGSTFNWNTNVIPDGQYKIRLTLACDDDILSTIPVNGVIDKTPPRKLGFPKPSSRTLESVEDIIGITFSESINSNIDQNNIEFINEITGNEVAFEFSVVDENIVIFPLLDLSSLPPAIYRINYKGIEDLYGNVIEAPISWTFSVGEISMFTCDENTIFYVDQNVSEGGRQNGLSWTDAYDNLTDAMNVACPGSKIYVAKGTYYPTDVLYAFDSDMLDTIPGDSIFFHWKRNFNWYGGFPSGGGEFEDRNPAEHPTIISGDANKDGVRNQGDCNMLLKIDRYVEGRMEGFILEEIYTDETIGLQHVSGAVYNEGDVDVVNCIFRNNEVVYANKPRGGTWFNLRGSPSFANCLFHDNSIPNRGAGIYMGSISNSTNLSLVNCTFYNNDAPTGSAIYSNGDDAMISNCIFYNNSNPLTSVSLGGGALLAVSHSSFQSSTLNAAVIDNGNNLLNNDPSFIDASSNDFKLMASSNCIGVGDNSTIEPLTELDLVGNQRILNTALLPNGTVDLGPYEIEPCGDVTTETKIHVDLSATTPGTGLSWTLPFTSLTQALIKSESCGIDTILVAEGVYYPETNTYTQPREASFSIPNGIFLAGGYASGGGDRNVSKHVTILSGNIGNPTVEADNVYHVVTIPTTYNPTTIEGFTIMGGNANEVGQSEGGGILHEVKGYGVSSKPIIKDCIIKYNTAIQGGGIANIADELGEASIHLINTTIRNNTATINGGAILDKSSNQGVTQMSIQNSLIYDNRSILSGGAIYQIAGDNSQTQSTIRNATIVDNVCGASGNGAGLNLNQTATGIVGSKVYNSIIYGNIQEENGSNQIWQSEENSLITLKNNNIEGGYGGSDLMEYNMDTIPYFIGIHIGNYGLDACSPLIDRGDDLEIDLSEDVFGMPRKVGIVDIGAVEYDGMSRRGNLPNTMDDIVINCANEIALPLPSDGVTYALYNDTLTILMAGPDIGDEPNKKMYSTSKIISDTTLSVVVGRDASYGIDFNTGNGFIEFDHQEDQNFNGNQTLKFAARINPTSTANQILYDKDINLTISIAASSLVFSTAYDTAYIELGITTGEWQSLTLEYTPISDTEALLVGFKNGEVQDQKLIDLNTDDSMVPVKIGAGSGGSYFEGMLDYLALNFDETPILQLDFLSAQGSDKAFDMRLASSGGAAQEGLLNNLNRYEVWLEGEDSYIKLCPDTLVLNVIMDPLNKVHFVENHLDEGALTLREKVFEACPNDTIRFANILMGDTIKFENEIMLDKHLFIEGLGMNGGTTLDGQGLTRLFNTAVNKSISYKDLQMINGYHPYTGGATPISSDCTLWNVRFKNNASGGESQQISLLPFSNLKIKGDVILNE